MFGTKKMYKKGLADAMSAYEAFGKKQEDALAEIRKEVREGKSQLEDALSGLSLIHISEPTRQAEISYAVFCLKKKKKKQKENRRHRKNTQDRV